MKKLFFIFFVCFLFLFEVRGEEAVKTNEVRIYFFHSNSCSHCQEEDKVLQKIESIYDNVLVFRYEVHDAESQNLLERVHDVYEIDVNRVPITVIGEQVFHGYQEDRSVVSFVKAIEYYSRYSYIDKVMGNQEVKSLYNGYENVIGYRDFVKKYYCYSLLGVNSDLIDTSICAVLIGVMSSLNYVSIISLILFFFLLYRVGGFRNKIILLGGYFLFTFLFYISEVIHNDYFSLGLGIILIIIFMWNMVRFLSCKKRFYLIFNFSIIIVMLTSYFHNIFYGNCVVMLKNIMRLHLLDGVEKYIYYVNYFVCIMFIYIMFILIYYLFFQKKLRR